MRGRTAILSIQIADFFNLLRQDKSDAENIRKQVDHLMLQYRGCYNLFGGFWRYIIIPLVLPN
jgi:hypothetical protein